MTSSVVALAGGGAFKETVRAMRSRGVGALPVPDGGAEQPPGAAAARAVTARDLATVPAVAVHADATVAGAARLMARHGVKQLPVVDEAGRLIGTRRGPAPLRRGPERTRRDRAPVPRDPACTRRSPAGARLRPAPTRHGPDPGPGRTVRTDPSAHGPRT
ncbi:CBS domain-containing protein [Streptomyces sp. NPDC003703]